MHDVTRIGVVAVGLLMGAACGAPLSGAKVGSCFAASSDDADVQVFQRDERRILSRLVDDAEASEPPASFASCSRGMPIVGEFIDDAGEHLWLALEAEVASREILPREILSVVRANATLILRQDRSWNISDTVFIKNGDQPVLAMQSGDRLEGSHGPLTVEDQGANGLPAFGPCGTTTSHGLTFSDDNRSQSAGNGETRELIVGGVEFSATHVASVEHGLIQCEDGPSEGLRVTWVAHDNSL